MIQGVPREIGFERLQVYGDDQKANEMLYREIAVLGPKSPEPLTLPSAKAIIFLLGN